MNKYAIIPGTNRPNAKTYWVADLYADTLQGFGIEAQMIDLDKLPRPYLFSEEYFGDGLANSFAEYAHIIENTDKFFVIVPEYNGSYPALLKAFIDGLPYPSGFKGKKIAISGLSSGDLGAALALSHLTDVFNYLGAHILAQKVRLQHIESLFDAQGSLIDEKVERRIRNQVEQMLRF